MITAPSEILREFHIAFEGFRTDAYLDGGGVPTIGIGHTNAREPHFKMGDTWTREKVDEVWRNDLQKTVNAVNKYFKTDNQAFYDTVIDMSFNAGVGPIRTSTFMKELQNGNFDKARRQILHWTYDNGKISLGLVRRAFARWYLFNNDIMWKTVATTGASRYELEQFNTLLKLEGMRVEYTNKGYKFYF